MKGQTIHLGVIDVRFHPAPALAKIKAVKNRSPYSLIAGVNPQHNKARGVRMHGHILYRAGKIQTVAGIILRAKNLIPINSTVKGTIQPHIPRIGRIGTLFIHGYAVIGRAVTVGEKDLPIFVVGGIAAHPAHAGLGGHPGIGLGRVHIKVIDLYRFQTVTDFKNTCAVVHGGADAHIGGHGHHPRLKGRHGHGAVIGVGFKLLPADSGPTAGLAHIFTIGGAEVHRVGTVITTGDGAGCNAGDFRIHRIPCRAVIIGPGDKLTDIRFLTCRAPGKKAAIRAHAKSAVRMISHAIRQQGAKGCRAIQGIVGGAGFIDFGGMALLGDIYVFIRGIDKQTDAIGTAAHLADHFQRAVGGLVKGATDRVNCAEIEAQSGAGHIEQPSVMGFQAANAIGRHFRQTAFIDIDAVKSAVIDKKEIARVPVRGKVTDITPHIIILSGIRQNRKGCAFRPVRAGKIHIRVKQGIGAFRGRKNTDGRAVQRQYFNGVYPATVNPLYLRGTHLRLKLGKSK